MKVLHQTGDADFTVSPPFVADCSGSASVNLLESVNVMDMVRVPYAGTIFEMGPGQRIVGGLPGGTGAASQVSGHKMKGAICLGSNFTDMVRP